MPTNRKTDAERENINARARFTSSRTVAAVTRELERLESEEWGIEAATAAAAVRAGHRIGWNDQYKEMTAP